jgi:DNA topoisomerase-1
LALLQDLYIGGWTSYPRTSSQKLPKELDFPTILKNLARMPVYEKLANFLLDKNKKKALTPNEGDKVDDAHPAIYPTGLSPQNITPRHEKMYDLVVKRFFATFGDPAVRESVKATIEVEKENFICKGTRTVEKNWHLLYEPYVKFEEIELPHFVKGQSVENKEISVLSKETKPPKRYTPASIIKELEKRGLGTKATRAAIVDNLFDRGYVNEKSIKATTIGIQTCEVLEKYCPEILDEQLTREIEDEMEDIRHKKKKPEEVKEHAIKFLTKTLIDFKKKEKEIGKGLLGASKDANSFAKCPNCEDGNILMRKGKFGRFLGCSNYPDCKTTYKLPQNGKITQTEQEAGKLLIKVQMPKKGAELIDLLTMNNNNNTSDGGAANSNNKNNPANDENRPKVTGEGDICAKCGKGKMTLRKSFHGFFLGCSNYPECKTIIPLKREEIIALAKPKENTEEKKEE